jgi:hypothetical protein
MAPLPTVSVHGICDYYNKSFSQSSLDAAKRNQGMAPSTKRAAINLDYASLHQEGYDGYVITNVMRDLLRVAASHIQEIPHFVRDDASFSSEVRDHICRERLPARSKW